MPLVDRTGDRPGCSRFLIAVMPFLVMKHLQPSGAHQEGCCQPLHGNQSAQQGEISGRRVFFTRMFEKEGFIRPAIGSLKVAGCPYALYRVQYKAAEFEPASEGSAG